MIINQLFKKLTFTFCLIAFVSFAKTKNDTLLFPKFAFQLNSGAGLSVLNDGLKDTYTKPDFSYSFGLGVSYFFTRNLFFTASVNQRQNSYLVKDIPNTLMLIDAFGNVNYDRVTYYNVKENYSYLTIPFVFNYKLPSKKNASFVFSTGFAVNYLNRYKFQTQNLVNFDEDADFNIVISNKQLNNFNVQRLNTSLLFGAGAFVNISPKMSLIIKPQFDFDLTAISFKRNQTLGIYNEFVNCQLQAGLLYFVGKSKK